MDMPTAQRALKDYFGFDDFRLAQKPVIARTLSGHSSLVIMPTGGGKSMCYQLPAILMPGITLVVSPLIALMQDQVQGLRANGVAAASMNSACSGEQEAEIKSAAESGEIKLLYVSPERAVSPSFLRWVSTLEVSHIAIDEAHCVSVWGNDFRPEYTQLTSLTRLYPNVPVTALTATADEATRHDIREQLGLSDCETFVSSFERKNITIDVLPAKNRMGIMRHFIAAQSNTPGIVYCLSRKSTEQVAQKLRAEGYRAYHYHGAMNSDERAQVQADFLSNKIHIICATIAFGMGVDKPDIRWIIHYNLPKNIESYYQEIGRAGRDGQAAEALLFAGYGDMKTLSEFVETGSGNAVFKQVQRAKLERMWEFSQSLSCRTNFILNYFGEYRAENCGHCDRCLNPPVSFDGTIIAQKALSAVYRLNQAAGINMVIDVLRGASNRQVLEAGYHTIKTYGAGKEHDWKSWQHYLLQLIDRGYLGIDFTRQNALHLTALSREVLKGNAQVTLCEQQEPVVTNTPKTVATDVKEHDLPLYEALSSLRSEIAERDNMRAFQIFSDQSLKDMAHKKPGNAGAFGTVHGVGEYKKEKYGDAFIAVIASLVPESERLLLEDTPPAIQPSKPKKSDFVIGPLSSTHRKTLELLKDGNSINEIARQRELNPATITSHILRLRYHDEEVDIAGIVSEDDIETIQRAWISLDKPGQIKALYLHLEERYQYEVIRYAVSLLKAGAQTV